MNNLYNKIYNAINEGIYKALIIPDEVNDSSVNYSHNKIKNNADVLSYYVQEILKGNDIEENYSNILQCSQNGQIYIIKNFNELNKLYYQLDKYIANIKLTCIDTSNVIQLLCSNFKKISLNQYDGSQDVHFIIIKGSDCGHDIILHKDLLIKMNLDWLKYTTELDYEKNPNHVSNTFIDIDCINSDVFSDPSHKNYKRPITSDYDGYNHTWHNADIKYNNHLINSNNYSVLYYVQNINIPGVQAYLPAAGELLFLANNQDLINDILKSINGQKLNLFQNWLNPDDSINGWWTSTEKNWYEAFF